MITLPIIIYIIPLVVLLAWIAQQTGKNKENNQRWDEDALAPIIAFTVLWPLVVFLFLIIAPLFFIFLLFYKMGRASDVTYRDIFKEWELFDFHPLVVDNEVEED